MLSNIWNTLLYQPLLNALVFLVSIIPGGNVGIAVIILTILVKLILFPISQKSIKNQAAMNMLAPEIKKIQKSGASKEEQARLQFELYKKHKVNPFSGCLLMIPTLIVIIALYQVFVKDVVFSGSLLYSFVHTPENINMLFFGFIDISEKSFILAVLAAVSQYLQIRFMSKPATVTHANNETGNSFQDNLMKSMSTQMQYVMPVLIFVICYTNLLGISLNGVVALYFITSNIFTMAQQIYVSKTEQHVLDEEVRVLTS